MATVSKGRTFVSGETVTPAKLNDLVDLATVTAIQAADISDAQITTAKIADANVTTAKLATTTQQGLLPAGAIMPFAMNSVPSGWLAADGSPVSRSTYAALFAAIGTTHGAGNGSTTFNLPDLRGYFVRGYGVAGDNGTNSDGTTSAAFGVKQSDAIKTHTHQITAGGYYGSTASGNTGWSVEPSYSGNIAITSSNPSTGTSAETRPANIALLYCIKT